MVGILNRDDSDSDAYIIMIIEVTVSAAHVAARRCDSPGTTRTRRKGGPLIKFSFPPFLRSFPQKCISFPHHVRKDSEDFGVRNIIFRTDLSEQASFGTEIAPEIPEILLEYRNVPCKSIMYNYKR
jgi:hypothetical protein